MRVIEAWTVCGWLDYLTENERIKETQASRGVSAEEALIFLGILSESPLRTRIAAQEYHTIRKSGPRPT